MSNNWNYASMGQRERLEQIRNGNGEVYKSEKIRNSSLKNLRDSLGLSTKEIDDWDKTIDNAYGNSGNSSAKSGLPKFGTGKYAGINKRANAELKMLKSERDSETAQTNEQFENALLYLEEWLSTNGYSSDGVLAEKSRKKLHDALEEALEAIRGNYKKQVESTKNKYRSMVM